ncbi:glycoside hydrolase superfamily [Zychaea mexicana]|uniref:glycoside hydrolase superfamily n=1 Tax=Zychaea mexicana TaxID=64656 RepID=UPI0022FE2ABA|nr:glycoside hydrolase superfamily [Zychaea mexicana]KAI9494087.1 glycoside hydrolase superfamily [Zychaea mexicana]
MIQVYSATGSPKLISMKSFIYTLLGAALASLPMMAKADDVFYGLDYGIEANNCPSLDKMKQDFQAAQKYTNRVRTFALHICDQADMALEATQSLGMNLYLGMWVDRQDTFDLEMQALKNVLEKHDLSNVDAIIVGSEVLYREDTDENTLTNWIRQVKEVVGSKGVKVTNAETYNKMSNEVINEVDFVSMNAFPYWEGVAIDEAADTLIDHYNQVKGMAGDKEVRISETGWPSEGDNFGAAEPSIENQNKYMQQVLCKTQQNNIDMLYFSLIEEPYRPGVEGHFGILDKDRNLKQGLDPKPAC